MNTKLMGLTAFAMGMAVGSAAAWHFAKTKYEKIAQEEIDSVKEVFSKRGVVETDPEQTTSFDTQVKSFREKPDLEEYAGMLRDQGYTEETTVDKPYVISPEEFGDIDGYEKISLIYYQDGVLADDNGEIVDNPDDTVGLESLTHFGEYEDDSVFVRNDARKCDYEILMDLRPYSEAVRPLSSMEEE